MVLESWVVTVTFRFDSRLVDLSNRLVLQRFTFYNEDEARTCYEEWAQKFSADISAFRCKM